VTLLLRYGTVFRVEIVLALQEKQVALARILRAEDLLLPNRLKIAVECRRGDPLGRGVALGDGLDGEDVGGEIVVGVVSVLKDERRCRAALKSRNDRIAAGRSGSHCGVPQRQCGFTFSVYTLRDDAKLSFP
jgi:hypothetical protein